MKIWD